MAKKVIQVVYQVNDKALISTKNTLDGIEKEAKQADDAVKKFGNDAKKSGEQASGSFANLRNVMDSIVALGIAAYFTKAAKAIFDLGVRQEQLNIAFTVFLGSASKAKSLIADLTKFSIVTPFTPEQVNKAAQALLAFGIKGEEVLPTLKMLGDVSAGTGKDLAEMAVIFGQIRAAGRLMGQDLLQLINAGFNPLQTISEQTGKSMLTLRKEMEAGAISFDMVTEAFRTVTSEGGLFFNLMDKQSATIGGKLSTITGNIAEIAKGIFESNIGLIGEFVDKLGAATNILLDWVQKANRDIVFDTAIKNTEGYRKVLEDAFKEFEAGKGPDAINKALAENVEATNIWAESSGELMRKVLKAEGEEFEALNTQQQVEAKTVKLLSELTQEYLNKIKKVVPAVRDLTKAEKDALKEREKFLKAFLKEGLTDPNEEQGINPFVTDKEVDEALNGTSKKLEAQTKIITDALRSQADIEFDNQAEANDKKLEQEKKHQEQIKELKEQAFNIGLGFIHDLLLADQNSVAEQIALEQRRTDEQIKLAGDNDRAKAEIEIKSARRLSELRDQQIREEKQNTIRRILIEGVLNAVRALGLPPIPGANFPAAGLALAQAAGSAFLAGKYKDGGWIKGPGSETSDSVPILASKNEFMVKASAARMSPQLLDAINDRRIDDRILKDLRVTSNGVVANLNDERIVNELRNNRPNSLSREGYTLIETERVGANFKRRIRKSILNS